jgi:hypothetical protein
MYDNSNDSIGLSYNDVLCIVTFSEGLEATPDFTGRSAINDLMCDSGVYTVIGSNCHYTCEYKLVYNLIVYDF